jgi:hypothetical protein
MGKAYRWGQMPGDAGGLGEVFPDAKYQRCVVHSPQLVFSFVPNQGQAGGQMLKASMPRDQESSQREG